MRPGKIFVIGMGRFLVVASDSYRLTLLDLEDGDLTWFTPSELDWYAKTYEFFVVA